LYGCETWSSTLTEKRKLRAFEDRGLRKLFGSNRDEVTGEWRRLHMGSFRDMYSLPNIIRVIKSWTMTWAGHVTYTGNRSDAYRVVGGGERPEETRLFGRSRSRWKDNNKMDLQEVGWGACNGLIWLRIRVGGSSCECGNKPSASIKCRKGGNFLTS